VSNAKSNTQKWLMNFLKSCFHQKQRISERLNYFRMPFIVMRRKKLHGLGLAPQRLTLLGTFAQFFIHSALWLEGENFVAS